MYSSSSCAFYIYIYDTVTVCSYAHIPQTRHPFDFHKKRGPGLAHWCLRGYIPRSRRNASKQRRNSTCRTNPGSPRPNKGAGLWDGPYKGFPTTDGQSFVFGLPGFIFLYHSYVMCPMYRLEHIIWQWNLDLSHVAKTFSISWTNLAKGILKLMGWAVKKTWPSSEILQLFLYRCVSLNFAGINTSQVIPRFQNPYATNPEIRPSSNSLYIKPSPVPSCLPSELS